MSVQSASLGQLLTVIRNGLNTAQFDSLVEDGLLPISRIETISAGTVDFARVKYAKVSEAERQKYQLQSGDILFSHINSPAHIGKTALFRSDQPLIHGVNLLLLRPNQASCNPEYLNYYLKSIEVRAFFRARCKKAVNQASLNQSDIKVLQVPLPPLPEQKRIAGILAKADRLRRLRRYALTLSDTYLQSVFLHLFGDPTANPMGWHFHSFDRVIAGTRNGTGQRRPVVSDGTIVLRIADVGAGSIDYSEPRRIGLPADAIGKYSLADNDLLLVRVNGNPNLVGRAALFKDIGEAVAFSDHIIRVRLRENAIVPAYLLHMLNSPYGRAQVLANVTTTAGQFTINRTGLSRISLPFPPQRLQQHFAEIVQRHERLRAQQREAQRQAEHLFQTLLHLAFQGEL